MVDEKSYCKHDYYKLYALLKSCEKYEVDLKNTRGVGVVEHDICCIRKAGVGNSFCSIGGVVDSVADYILKMRNFKRLIPILA